VCFAGRRERASTSFLTPRFRFSGWGSPPIVRVGGMPAILAHMFACASVSSACFTSMAFICFAKKAFIPTSFSSVGSKSARLISAITAGRPADQRSLTTEAARRRAAERGPGVDGGALPSPNVERRLRQLIYHKSLACAIGR